MSCFYLPVLTQHSARHLEDVQYTWSDCREKPIGNRYLMERKHVVLTRCLLVQSKNILNE